MTDLRQVFMPSVINTDGERTELGLVTQEEDAWAVLRAFFARAEETDCIAATIDVWEVDYVGEEPRTELAYLQRRPCPICERSSFWSEMGEANFKGDKQPLSGRCYRLECASWVEPNNIEVDRFDCGWPAAPWTKRCESFNLGIRGLVEMRGAVTASGRRRRSTMSKELMDEL